MDEREAQARHAFPLIVWGESETTEQVIERIHRELTGSNRVSVVMGSGWVAEALQDALSHSRPDLHIVIGRVYRPADGVMPSHFERWTLEALK